MNKLVYLITLTCLGALFHKSIAQKILIPSQDDKLWFDKPAEIWTEALPLGNGYMGAMVFGGIEKEHLQLNESTLYSGDPKGTFKNIDIRKYFPEIDSLMKAGKYAEAQNAIHEEWLGRNHQSYQPMGDLWIELQTKGTVSNYKRVLNLANATAKISYEANGTSFTREYFASYPDHAIVIRLTAKGKDKLNGKISFSTPHEPTAEYKIANQQLIMTGKAPGFVVRRTLKQIEEEGDQYKYPEIFDKEGKRLPHAKQVLYGDEINNLGMAFDTRLKVIKTDGKVNYSKDQIELVNVSEISFVVSAATSYNGFDKSPATDGKDASKLAATYISNAAKKTYDALKSTHVHDYQNLFNRVKIDLSPMTEQSSLPTDQRVLHFSNQKDLSLPNLYFQFGRYLTIAGSREGGQPLNLQGIWNDLVIPPWNGAYTTNINAEMNYWPSELTNLSECQAPFFQAIKELAINGQETARNMYGNDGWVVHHNMDIWRHTEPIDFCNCSFWPMGAGWFVSHFWEHYLYSGDKKFLKEETLPLLKGAVLFYKDWLVPNKEGYLVTPMGHSPEHQFRYGNNQTSTLSPGPTMDMAIIRESFERFLEANKVLGIKEELNDEIATKLQKLLPYQIGKYGQLQEWSEDFEDGDKEHRHISHLYPFYPGNQINDRTTPELNAGVARVMERRGDQATGWSMGWKINVQARLQNGDKSYTLLSNLLTLIKDNDRKNFHGKTYPNLFDAAPPFQIDGNLGATAGIAEMLVQSHAGEIHLLPALPAAWKAGKVTGLKTRGGFLLDMEWENGQIKTAVITSTLGGTCLIRTNEKTTSSDGESVADPSVNTNPLFQFIQLEKPLIKDKTALLELIPPTTYLQQINTQKGGIYRISKK